MHFNKKLPEEVYAMEPMIKEFVESDAGAGQFIARYGEATASPVVRQAYQDWVLADFRERSMLQGARDEGKAEGKAEGMAEGISKGMAEGISKGMAEGISKGKTEECFAIAKNAIAMKMPISQIEQLTGLTRAQIEESQR
jgi:predicted transposase YdaD